MFFLDKLQEPFYFGIGGIGDLLLLLSTFYDNVPQDEKVNLIFWANDKTTIESFLQFFDKKEQKLNHKIIFQGWQSKDQFDAIVQHPLFKGKGHIPDELQYVREWSQNPNKYRSQIPQEFKAAKALTHVLDTPYRMIGISCWGSQTDAHKQKWLTDDEFNSLVQGLLLADPMHQIVIFGSQDDKKHELTIKDVAAWRIIDLRGRSWDDVFIYLGLCQRFIGTDSVFKIISYFLGIPTTVIKTRFLLPPQQVFGGLDKDPADNIFLDGYGFDILPIELLLEKIYQNNDRKLIKNLIQNIK